MTENYKPKQGDRVRVVLEGEARIGAFGDGFNIGRPVSNFIDFDAEHVVSVEKLAPPEPKWVYGAAVRVKGQSATFTSNGNGWYIAGGVLDFRDLVSAAWNNGTLKILWNGDSDD